MHSILNILMHYRSESKKKQLFCKSEFPKQKLTQTLNLIRFEGNHEAIQKILEEFINE